MLEGKTGILGVGAQKCGTSWLFAYLRTCPGVCASTIKELHFFDSLLEPDRFTRFNGFFVRTLSEQLAQHGEKAVERSLVCDLLDRVRAIHHPEGYLGLFERLMKPEDNVFLDFTPAYSLLTADSYRAIRDYFSQADVKFKVVFIMRDPIDRYHSALRMQQRECERRGERFSVHNLFDALLNEPRYHERTRYDWTLQNLLSVFPREIVFFTFYEKLFSQSELRELTDFLGVGYAPPDFAQRRNVSPQTEPLTNAQLDRARHTFAPVYRYCSEMFGDQLPDAWRVHADMHGDWA
jgi:hypothetical protein